MDPVPQKPGPAPATKSHGGDPSGSSIVGRLVGGDFEIRREIGRGGMGTVYEAWQHSLRRVVALKVLANTLGLSGNAVVRFRREAQAAAKLHHGNIVPIHAQGEEDGVYFYAMDYIDGPSLNEIINERRGGDQTPRELDLTETKLILGADAPAENGAIPDADRTRFLPADTLDGSRSKNRGPAASKSTVEYFDHIAEHIAAVADALDYAHHEGVIHRDIKPHNCILGKDGRMWVTDFGLARVLEQPGVTTTGEFIGSPLYMSPEQITGGRGGVDHRTDIYSLGATMYEWLTLSAPYPGDTREQVISKIISGEPDPPRWLDPSIPADLETVCLKALEKNPDDRYGTAAEMARDLRSYLKRYAIRARRGGLILRTRRLIARNRTPVFVGAAMVVIAGAAIITSMIQNRSFRRVRAQQHQELAAIEGDKRQLQDQINDLEAKQKRIFQAIQEGNTGPLAIGRDIVSWFQETPPELVEAPEAPGVAGPVAPETQALPVALGEQDRELIGHLAAELAGPLREAAEGEVSMVGVGIINSLEADKYYRQALDASDPNVALELVNNALRNYLGHFNAMYLRAIIYAQLGDFEQVVTEAEAMVRFPLDKRSPAGHVMRGIGRLCTGDVQPSVLDFSDALELDADNPRIWMMRGMARLFAGDYAAGFADLDRAVQLGPDNPAAYVARGAGHARRGNFVQAIDDLEKAVRMGPEHAAANLERDRVWDRIQSELRSFTEILADRPNDSTVLEQRGDLYALLGDYEAALADYQKAGRLDPRASLIIKGTLVSRELRAQQSAIPSAKPDGQPPAESDPRNQMDTIPDWLRGIIP